MIFRVIEIEEKFGDMIIRFCSVDEKGRAVVDEKGWFIELWRPKTAFVKVGDEFEITFRPLLRKKKEASE